MTTAQHRIEQFSNELKIESAFRENPCCEIVLERPKTISTSKSPHFKPTMLTGLSEGIHPNFNETYQRATMREMTKEECMRLLNSNFAKMKQGEVREVVNEFKCSTLGELKQAINDYPRKQQHEEWATWS